jgi:hypothetical protein
MLLEAAARLKTICGKSRCIRPLILASSQVNWVETHTNKAKRHVLETRCLYACMRHQTLGCTPPLLVQSDLLARWALVVRYLP